MTPHQDTPRDTTTPLDTTAPQQRHHKQTQTPCARAIDGAKLPKPVLCSSSGMIVTHTPSGRQHKVGGRDEGLTLL